MTLLIGQNNISGYTTQSLFTNAVVWYGKFVAVASGTAQNIYVYAYNHDVASDFELCIWNGTTGAVIATSAALTNGVDGWQSAAISASIVSGTTYCLGKISDAYCGFYSSGNTFYQNSNTYTYPTPPAVAPGSDPGGNTDFAIYVDGTTGGSSHPSQFFLSKNFTGKAALAAAPLAWIINRRDRVKGR